MYRLTISIVGVCCLGFANTVFFRAEYDAIEKAAELAKSPNSQHAALFALERLAEGKPESVPGDIAAQIGLSPTSIGWTTYRQLPIRTYAIQKLAETGTEDALVYLSSLNEDEFAPNAGERTQLELAVEVGQRTIQLLRAPDQAGKVQLLEKAAVEPGFAGQTWAVDQLCEMGSVISFPVIQQSIRARYYGDEVRGDGELQFCQQRMAVIESNPDRVKALSSVLSSNLDIQNTRLVSWAVSQLLKIGSPDAVDALQSFSTRVANAAGLAVLVPFKTRVDEELRHKAARSRQ